MSRPYRREKERAVAAVLPLSRNRPIKFEISPPAVPKSLSVHSRREWRLTRGYFLTASPRTSDPFWGETSLNENARDSENRSFYLRST